MLAEQMNKAQNQAELRRQFYVALTRVKDRLIFVGSSNSLLNDDDSMVEMKVNAKGNNMGDLMLDGSDTWGSHLEMINPEFDNDDPRRTFSRIWRAEIEV